MLASPIYLISWARKRVLQTEGTGIISTTGDCFDYPHSLCGSNCRKGRGTRAAADSVPSLAPGDLGNRGLPCVPRHFRF